MPIAELGYRPWQGTRVRRLWRWLSITRSDIGIAYRGSKLLRRFLILAWMPLLYFGPVFFAVGYVADPANDLAEGGMLTEIAREVFPWPVIEELRARPEVFLPAVWAVAFYFFFAYTQSFLAMVVVAIVGPPLIAKDVRSKAFLLYFSKPIGSWEYLLGKLGVVLFWIFGITLFPALLLYGISIAFSPDVGTLFATAPIVLRICLASVAIALPISLVILLLSSLTKDRRVATFGWAAIWLLGEVAYRAIAFGGTGHSDLAASGWAFLASLREVTITATAAVFDLEGHVVHLATELRAAGIDVDALIRGVARDVGDSGQIQSALAAATDSGVVGSAFSSTAAVVWLTAVSAVCAVAVLRRITGPLRI